MPLKYVYDDFIDMFVCVVRVEALPLNKDRQVLMRELYHG